MVNEFYQGLPSNYANYEDVVIPKHESMREKICIEGVYEYYDHWNKDPSILGSSMEVKDNVRTLLSDFIHL